jgi:hypothetical protein
LVYGVEVEDPFTVGEIVSPRVLGRLEEIVKHLVIDLNG